MVESVPKRKNPFVVCGKIIIIIISVAFAIAILIAAGIGYNFFTTLSIIMFFAGVITLGIGALVSAGVSEYAIQTAPAMFGTHHSKYFENLRLERGKRRDEQFYFMILMFLAGLGMFGIAGLLTLV